MERTDRLMSDAVEQLCVCMRMCSLFLLSADLGIARYARCSSRKTKATARANGKKKRGMTGTRIHQNLVPSANGTERV